MDELDADTGSVHRYFPGVLASARQHSGLFVALIAAGLVAIVRDVMVGRRLGLSGGLDAWTLSLGVVAFVTGATITSLGATIVPSVRAAEIDDSYGSASEVRAAVALFAAGIGTVLGLVCIAGATQIARLVASGSSSTRSTATLVTILSITAVPAAVVRGAHSAILQADRRFVLPALIPIVSALAVIVAVGGFDVGDVRWLAVVHGLGIVTEVVWLTSQIARHGAFRASSGRKLWAIARRYRAGTAAALFGAIGFSLNPIIDLGFAARFGDGQAGRLGLASRMTIAASAVLASTLAVPAFPRFVDALAVGGTAAFRRHVRRAIVAGLAVGGALTIALVAVTIPLADILFTGDAMTREQARSIGWLQMTYSATAAPYIAAAITLRALHALGAYRRAMVIGLMGCGANVAVDAVLSAWIGIHGLAIATTVVYASTAAAMAASALRLEPTRGRWTANGDPTPPTA